MKVCVLAAGIRDEVSPALAFATGLLNVGHDVILLTHQDYAEDAAANKVPFHAVAGNTQILSRGILSKGFSVAHDFQAMIDALVQVTNGLFDGAEKDFFDGCTGADVIVAMPLCFEFGYTLAEHFCIPLIGLSPHPTNPSPLSPMVLLQSTPIKGIFSFVNVLVHEIYAYSLWCSRRETHNEWRKKLNLNPIKNWFGVYTLWQKCNIPTISTYSSIVGGLDSLNKNNCIVGFINGSWGGATSSRLGEKIEGFLSSGARPVYFGIGFLPDTNYDSLLTTTLQAIDRVGCRAIIASGSNSINESKSTKAVLFVKDAPAEHLFPRCKSVLHHCSSTSTAAVLYAGVPSIAVPVHSDNFFWAEQIHKLGVCPNPVPYSQMNVDVLSESIICSFAPNQSKCAQSVRSKLEMDGNTTSKALERFQHLVSQRTLVNPGIASTSTIWLLPQLRGIVSSTTLVVSASFAITAIRAIRNALLSLATPTGSHPIKTPPKRKNASLPSTDIHANRPGKKKN